MAQNVYSLSFKHPNSIDQQNTLHFRMAFSAPTAHEKATFIISPFKDTRIKNLAPLVFNEPYFPNRI